MTVYSQTPFILPNSYFVDGAISGTALSGNAPAGPGVVTIGRQSWRAFASSSSGASLIGVSRNTDGSDGAQTGFIWLSHDTGTTWERQDPPGRFDWFDCCISTDGTKLAACVYGGNIWVSTNSGTTWIAQATPTKNWMAVTMSDDGTRIAAVSLTGEVWTSANSGVSWTGQAGVTATGIDGMAADSTGLILITGDNVFPYHLYTSTNGGVSWITASAYLLGFPACSPDGSRVLGLPGVSTDFGVTFDSSDAGGQAWKAVSMSDNGVVRVTSDDARAFGEFGAYVSTDSGATYVRRITINNSLALCSACSASGAVIVIGQRSDLPGGDGSHSKIWVSVNTGVTFTAVQTLP